MFFFSFLVNERFNTAKLEDPMKFDQNLTPLPGMNSNDATAIIESENVIRLMQL